MSHLWHSSGICVTLPIHMCAMPPHLHVCHYLLTCVARFIHRCDMKHACVKRLTCVPCVIRLIHVCAMIHSRVIYDSFVFVWYDSILCETWIICMHDTIYSRVCHDPFICVPCLILHMHHMYYSRMCHDSVSLVTRLNHWCAKTHSHMRRDSSSAWLDSFIWVAPLIDICAWEWVVTDMWISDTRGYD